MTQIDKWVDSIFQIFDLFRAKGLAFFKSHWTPLYLVFRDFVVNG